PRHGRVLPSHGWRRRFNPCTAHHKTKHFAAYSDLRTPAHDASRGNVAATDGQQLRNICGVCSQVVHGTHRTLREQLLGPSAAPYTDTPFFDGPLHSCQAGGARVAAAIIGILPLDGNEILPADNQQGFPEGAVTTVTTNRYERDRRNRAAAIAIHG